MQTIETVHCLKGPRTDQNLNYTTSLRSLFISRPCREDFANLVKDRISGISDEEAKKYLPEDDSLLEGRDAIKHFEQYIEIMAAHWRDRHDAYTVHVEFLQNKSNLNWPMYSRCIAVSIPPSNLPSTNPPSTSSSCTANFTPRHQHNIIDLAPNHESIDVASIGSNTNSSISSPPRGIFENNNEQPLDLTIDNLDRSSHSNNSNTSIIKTNNKSEAPPDSSNATVTQLSENVIATSTSSTRIATKNINDEPSSTSTQQSNTAQLNKNDNSSVSRSTSINNNIYSTATHSSRPLMLKFTTDVGAGLVSSILSIARNYGYENSLVNRRRTAWFKEQSLAFLYLVDCCVSIEK